MPHRRESDEESTVLSAPAAARLLERASELDAARLSEVRVAELRAAATEAGISADAFNAALEELQRPAPPAVVEPTLAPRPPRGRWKLLVGFAAAAAMFMVFGVQRSAGPTVPVVDETFLLRCLTSSEAAALIRPIVGEQGMVYSRADADRVLTVRAPRPQIERVRAELTRLESPNSAACAVRR